MSNDHQQTANPAAQDESAAEHTSDEWIDETMAEGDIANGEGDPESQPERSSEK